MIKSKYSCETCTDTSCWLCKGNVYYDKVMSLNISEVKEHKYDIATHRDLIRVKGCASNTNFVEGQKKVLELLKELEWSGDLADCVDLSYAGGYSRRGACSSCSNAKRDGHKPNCKLAEMLK